MGFIGIIVQILLGVISLSALLIKRYMENPKRPWIIWLLDTSKQVFSAFMAHFMNVFAAMFLNLESQESDDCDWYFVNICSDVLIGTALCYLILKTIEIVAIHNQIFVLNTGMYVKEDYQIMNADEIDPTQRQKVNKIDYSIWAIQILVWTFIVIIVKVLLGLIMKLIAPTLEFVTSVLIGWMNIYPTLKLILIMMVIPMTLNAIQFWVQDNILMAQKEKNIEFSAASRLSRSLTVKPKAENYFQSFKRTKRSESVATTTDHVFRSTANTNNV